MDETNDTGEPTGDAAADEAGERTRSPARWAMWIGVGLVAVVALGFGAIFIYANFINDPADELTADDLRERLEAPATVPTTAPAGEASDGGDDGDTAGTTDDTTTTEPPPPLTTPLTAPPVTESPAAPDAPDVEGEWRATPASELGYRVTEVLFGVDTEGVGRTNDITGSLVIQGTTVVATAFEVDMATVESDDSRRDGQFRGRIMTVAEYPTADFVLTEPIELGEIPPPGEQITATATGDLTLRGVTNPVTFDVTAQLQGDRIGVLGTIPVVFADHDIVNPSIAGITTEDNGLLEFVLVFER